MGSVERNLQLGLLESETLELPYQVRIADLYVGGLRGVRSMVDWYNRCGVLLVIGRSTIEIFLTGHPISNEERF